MSYESPGCAYCPPTVRACRHGESESRGPGFCPSKVDEEGIERAWERYEDSEVRRVARASALVESAGYWVRGRIGGVQERGCAEGAARAADEDKIRPGTYEPMCNPLSQAELLNDAGCELNVVLGLCVGHDSLFFKYSKGLATTLVAKDRVLAHNPVGALQLADTYFQRVWGPLRPTEAPKLPAGGRD